MQDKEFERLFSSLDGITPPAGVKEKLLYERILKQKETPVNEADSEAEVFALIEDKRSDIAAPIAAEEELFEETETDKNTAPSPTGEAHGAAIVKQSKFYMYFGIIAACIAVVAVGALAISLFTGRGRVETLPADSNDEMKEKIFSEGETLYKKLEGSTVYYDAEKGVNVTEDKEGGGEHAYALADGGYIVFGGEQDYGAVVLDHDKKVVVEKKDVFVGASTGEFIASTPSYGFFGANISLGAGTGSEVIINAIDLHTLEFESFGDSECFLGAYSSDYAPQASITDYAFIPADYTNYNDDAEDYDEYELATLLFILDYKDENGNVKSTLYRQRKTDSKAAPIYELTNETDSKNTVRLEGIYASESFQKSDNYYVIYSSTPKNTGAGGLYKKTYYITALPSDKGLEPVTEKLFEEYDSFSYPNFTSGHTVVIPKSLYQVGILNNNTGVITAVADCTIMGKDGYNMYGDDERYLEIRANTSLVPLPSYDYIGFSRFTAVNQRFYEEIEFYLDENGYTYSAYDYNNVASLKDKTLKRVIEYEEVNYLIFARIDYGTDGKPVQTLIAFDNYVPSDQTFSNFFSLENEAISFDDGCAVMDIVNESKGSYAVVHTKDDVFKKAYHS